MHIASAWGRALIGARAAYGAAAILAPKATVRLLMLRPDAAPDHGQSYVVRMLGTRECFLAAAQAGLAGTPANAAAAWRLGMAVDAIDTVSVWLAHRDGRANTPALFAYTAAGVVATIIGYLAAEAAANDCH